MNKIISLIFLIFLLPVFLLLCIYIIIFNGFPIFFIQKRFGKDNQLFNLIKFRTMKISSPTISTENFKNAESYIIKGGKFLRKYSLDELPQLINILRGEMNFIGPRPSMIEGEELLFELRTKKGVDKMKPGITGWAQVNGRDSISFQQKVELDEYYLKNKSIFLNIKIILLTLKILFKTRLVKH